MGKKSSVRDYIINVLNGMAWGLFSSLLIGLIIKQLGTVLHLNWLISLGQVAQVLMAPAIGVGVAYVLKAPALVVMSSAVTGAVGGGTFAVAATGITATIGEPAGAFVAALVGAEAGRRIAGKTKVDIVLVPMLTIACGGLAGIYLSPYFAAALNALGQMINAATELNPLPMGIIISVVMGMILTLPISSAAIAIALNLSGLAAGAATVGCCANMIGFAVISYRENGVGGFIAQGLGTSMLQVPNIIRNPWTWLPSIVASAILGPISTVVLKMTSISTGAGMGTSGLVGQFAMIESMGASTEVFLQMGIMHFLAPGIISYGVCRFLSAKGRIRPGDLTLQKIS